MQTLKAYAVLSARAIILLIALPLSGVFFALYVTSLLLGHVLELSQFYFAWLLSFITHTKALVSAYAERDATKK
jgi:hypothetical protein